MSGPLSLGQWRGLVTLTRDAVVETSRAVEQVHLRTARRSFAVLEKVPVVRFPTAVVRAIHDATVSSVHLVIRLTTSAVGTTLGAGLEAAARATTDPRPDARLEAPRERGAEPAAD
jgi:hypothetical protein